MVGERAALLETEQGSCYLPVTIYWFLSHYLTHSSPPTYALSSLHRPLRVVSSSTLPRPGDKRYSHNKT